MLFPHTTPPLPLWPTFPFPNTLPYEWHPLQDLGSPARDEEISPLHPKVWDFFLFASAFCVGFCIYIS